MSSAADPFLERAPARLRAHLHVLGGEFTVESDDRAPLDLAVEAFGGLPRHRLGSEPRRFRVRLAATDGDRSWPRSAEPPRPTLVSGAGLLCATVDAHNFVVVDVALSRALVCVSRAMFAHRYHARYELVELAFLTLASRAQALVPLHAACIGAGGSGVLLIGPSGAGKSTLALHALASGLEVLAEDSAFVDTGGLRVTGVPNYVHVPAAALASLERGPLEACVRRAPVIQRRSGVRKHEVDLRAVPGRIAATPLRLAAVVFLSPLRGASAAPLVAVGPDSLLRRLRREQPYAAGLESWAAFERRIVDVPAYELRRTGHPREAVARLEALLGNGGVAP
ncbi:MAG TPA: serine kinase [Gammaproteobacteria bacterium]